MSATSGREPLGRSGSGFYRLMFFLSLNQQCQSTEKKTQSTDPNQWPGLILSSSSTRLLMEGPLVCLCWLCIMTTLGCLTPVYSISHCYLICHSRDICRYFEHSFCCFFTILGSLSQICWQLNELLLAYCSVCKGKGKCFPILDTERWARS